MNRTTLSTQISENVRNTIKNNLIHWSRFESRKYNNTCWLFDHNYKKFYYFYNNRETFQNFTTIKKILPKKSLFEAYHKYGLQLFFSNLE